MNLGFTAYIECPKQSLEIKVDSKTGKIQIGDFETSLQDYTGIKWVVQGPEQTLQIKYDGMNVEALLGDLERLLKLTKKAGLCAENLGLSIVFSGAQISMS